MEDSTRMIIDQLNRIEEKLDSKVSKEVCTLRHSKAKEIRIWLSIAISTITLLGMLYTTAKVVDLPQQDKVTYNGK